MILWSYAPVLVLVLGFGEISFRPIVVYVLKIVRFRRKIKMSISVLFQGVNEITGFSFWTYKIKLRVCVPVWVHMCICMCVYVCICVYVCAHMCIY